METELSNGGFIGLALGGCIGLAGGNYDGLYDCMILLHDSVGDGLACPFHICPLSSMEGGFLAAM